MKSLACTRTTLRLRCDGADVHEHEYVIGVDDVPDDDFPCPCGATVRVRPAPVDPPAKKKRSRKKSGA